MIAKNNISNYVMSVEFSDCSYLIEEHPHLLHVSEVLLILCSKLSAFISECLDLFINPALELIYFLLLTLVLRIEFFLFFIKFLGSLLLKQQLC